MGAQREEDSQAPNDKAPQEGQGVKTITPALVAQIADKVYAQLLFDWRIERERYHLGIGRQFTGQGGW